MTSSAALDFAIIGAQKSASTYLHRVLQGHPRIDIPSVESRNFEDPWYAAGGLDELPRLFGPRHPDVRRGIKRPDHLADPLVPTRMTRAAPDVRVLVVLREPVARAVSAYLHYVRLGFLPPLPVDDAFARILDGSLGRRFPRADDVIGYGLYAAHLRRWLEVLPREQLLVLAQTDLRDTPAEQVAGVLGFLGVDPSPAARLAASTPRANPSTYDPVRIRAQRLVAVLSHRYTPDRYRRVRRRNPVRLGAAGVVSTVDRHVLARRDHAAAPRLAPALEEELRDRYRADGEDLVSLFGRTFWPDA